MATTVGILQPSYLPWLGYFEQIARCDVFVLYDDVQFDKGGWRNRNRIKIPGGPHWLTVPVLTKGGPPLVRDVRVNNTLPWSRNHLKTLVQYYSKALHFAPYFEELSDILNRPWELLAALDRAVIEWMCGAFGISTPLVWSSELGVAGDRLDRLIAIVKHFGGNAFYEGAAGRDYIPVDYFTERGVEVIFQNYRHPVYPQLHGDFISHLSAIDLLFNLGPESKASLLSGA
ncbi:WbqC family protein [Fundidesulfovibrio agrisoli]|uniref:WbqC family protein n=1 Tax=Fundidesulfovibrio agrisoli TaxID=2922717 RepID=UPI001FAC9185|nr:WbqC family protein [Fundidesulfovibrio agrisoli]